MANPLVPQGVLNKIKATVVWTSNPSLNITAPFLGAGGISLSFEGNATAFLPSMTGAVTSPEPYVMATFTMNLLRTQQMAELYKQKLETNSLMGDCTIYPDVVSGGIGNYPITNCALETVSALSFAGGDAGWVVSVRGYYLLNSVLFD